MGPEPAKEEEYEEEPNQGDDIFKHTFVDVLENKPQPETQQTEMSLREKQPKDIFYFYNMNFDLPTEYYKQLGDFNIANRI